MRGLSVCCFVIASLAFASSQEATKIYEYTNNNLIHANKTFAYNQLTYAVCEGKEVEKKCTIYQESILDNTKAAQSCDLNLKIANSDFRYVNLQNLGKDYVVVIIKDDSKNKLIIVNMSNCSVKETGIETDTESSVYVIPKNDNYDAVFKNNKLCNDFYCKATYDYDGKVVKEAAAFDSLKTATSFLKVIPAGRGFLVGERRVDGQINVYFVPGDDQQGKLLFSTPNGSTGDIYSLATEENKLSFCVVFDRKVLCQQYDAEGKTKHLQVEYPITVGYLDIIDVLNLEQGLLVLSIEHPMRSNGQPAALIVNYNVEGNRAKILNADLNCKGGHFSTPKLYKNSSGEYCVVSICRKYMSENILDSGFTRTNKCFAKSELA